MWPRRGVGPDAEESANGRSSSRSGGEPAASARRRTGKVDRGVGRRGGEEEGELGGRRERRVAEDVEVGLAAASPGGIFL